MKWETAKSFAIRAALTAVAAGLAYMGANVTDVADPAYSGIGIALITSLAHLVDAYQKKFGAPASE